MGIGDFDTSLGSGGMFSTGGGPSGGDHRSPLDDVAGGAEGNAELQEFIALEQQKQQLRQTIATLTDTCWEKCIGTPGSRLDSKTENCLQNCVHRFFDVTVMITNRFAQALQRQGGM